MTLDSGNFARNASQFTDTLIAGTLNNGAQETTALDEVRNLAFGKPADQPNGTTSQFADRSLAFNGGDLSMFARPVVEAMLATTPPTQAQFEQQLMNLANNATVRRNGEAVTITLPQPPGGASYWYLEAPPDSPIAGMWLPRTLTCNATDNNGTITLNNLQGVSIRRNGFNLGISSITITNGVNGQPGQITASTWWGISPSIPITLNVPQSTIDQIRQDLQNHNILPHP